MHIHRRRFLSSAIGAAAASAVWQASAAADKCLPKDVPWLAEVQQPPEKLPANAPTLSGLLIDDSGRKITDLAGWAKRRTELTRKWGDVLKPVRLDRRRPKLDVLEEDRKSGCLRQLVRFESEPGVPIDGYLPLQR